MKKIVVLGSTGSIGTQTLQIVDNNLELFTVEGLCCRSNWRLLAKQARTYYPKKVAIADRAQVDNLKEALSGMGIQILAGPKGVEELAAMPADMVVVALVGIAGLIPTLNAIENGKVIALANKETLVVGGELVMKKAREKGVSILPVDSEHSAIFQCLTGEDPLSVQTIHLTSSGGPFRETPSDELDEKTAADALKHPTWNMGEKVTIDSATLMNKGFEVIEAKWLFDVDPDQINVIVHPQSVIHSMVEFIDGSIKAQLSSPDMRIPIQYAMSYPERLFSNYVDTNFIRIGSLTFEEPRFEDFPCLEYAYRAIKTGGTMPAVLNAANEVAVHYFLNDQLSLTGIPGLILKAMEHHRVIQNPTVEDVMDADNYARKVATDLNRSTFLR